MDGFNFSFSVIKVLVFSKYVICVLVYYITKVQINRLQTETGISHIKLAWSSAVSYLGPFTPSPIQPSLDTHHPHGCFSDVAGAAALIEIEPGSPNRWELVRFDRLPVKPVRTGSGFGRYLTGQNSKFKFKFKK